ncbi:MAG: hypothetical protein GTN53_22160, partial [Candidatus Aminicenantes bacterium]|nr:hypothetical protein [Candidatus Aminicenantes bacterium]NIQ69207.1 hypothetical protein [Candidatus Aminicenantes bacterium]NIT25210.1 hypothetical protein [Candidatus Aminicenantes bacterium]
MRKLIAILSAIAVLLFFNGDAYAWHARGNVLCEADGIEGISPGDIPLPGVRV